MNTGQTNNIAPKILGLLRNLFFLFTGLGLLYITFREQDLSKILIILMNVNYFWVIISLLILIPAHISRAMRWQILIEPLGYTPSLKKTFFAVMAGYLANLALPKLGEIYRCWALKDSQDISISKLLGTVIIERIVDIIILLLLLLFSIIFNFKQIGSFFIVYIIHPLGKKVNIIFNHWIFLLVILIIIIILTGLIYLLLKKNLQTSKLLSYILKKINNLKEGLTTLKKIQNIKGFLLHTFFMWIIYILSLYLCFFALNTTSNLTIMSAIYLTTLSGLAWAAPIQGGIGAFHWIVTKGLVLGGVAQTDALAFATLRHGSGVVLLLVMGGICTVLLLMSRSVKLKN